MKNNQSFRHLLKKIKSMDISFLVNIYLLVIISLVFVYSATIDRTRIYFYKELIWVVMGTFVFLGFSLVDFRIYQKYSKIIYMFNIMFLISVYIFGIEIMGAKRWLRLGSITIQPSEFAKIFIILTFAELLISTYKKGVRSWKGILRTGIHIIPVFLLIMKQPDLGTSLALVFLYYLMIFLHGVDMVPFFSLIGINIAMIPVAFLFVLKQYQRKRILVFLNPEKDILNDGWNVVQSIIAVGSGGFWGKGLFRGTQNKLRFLPESHTDFIFSVIAEETGFFGGAFLILLYLTLIISIINIGMKSENVYGRLVAYGIAGIFFFHTFINIGMVIGIMPVTGLPLLLMSYGGSSYLFTFMMLGIVQSIKIYGKN